MKVIFISECSKKALKNTRRILDQFSVRKGRRIWITDITEEGLDALRDLLKRTARKNTSIICYKVFGYTLSILFFIGNKKMFNEFGDVATNITSKNLTQKYADEQISSLTDTIALVSKLAGLFHDFGKASPFFQNKLKSANNLDEKKSDQIRHEYLSAFFLFDIGKKENEQEKNDRDFLENLTNTDLIKKRLLFCENYDDVYNRENSIAIGGGIILKQLPPIAELITLLCLTHHKLPVNPKHVSTDKKTKDEAHLEVCSKSNTRKVFHAGLDYSLWGYTLYDPNNYIPANPVNIKEKSLYDSYVFINALTDTVREFKERFELIENQIKKNKEIIFHYARFCLMLADHVYSSQPKRDKHHDINSDLIANTKNGDVNQFLDNHTYYVSKYAYKLALTIMKLKSSLPQLQQQRVLSTKAKDKFAWQNEAYEKSAAIENYANKYGFFGVNAASTGTGKTLCNAKIMGAINTNGLCRFSYAIPLRSLTLQTGNALKEKLMLNASEIGIKIGASTLQELYEVYKNKIDLDTFERSKSIKIEGSESIDIVDDGITLLLNDSTNHNHTNKLPKEVGYILQGKFKSNYKTYVAPILACTVDTIISASEGIKGGKQLAAILRLISSDLIMDETDELDLQDQNAACRLAFFAGLCGSKLLLSSASMQPYLVKAMFLHYQKGRSLFNRALGVEDNDKICAGFFGEFFSETAFIESDGFDDFYEENINNHILGLIGNKRLFQRAKFIDIKSDGDGDSSIKAMAEQIYNSILKLSSIHFTSNNTYCVSTGLVRFANINTLIKVAKLLIKEDAPENTCIHYCIYHSQYTIAQRAHIEKIIDALTNRKEDFFSRHELKEEIDKSPKADKHIFVTISSPVSEIGRDNDYDFAIVEPSSFRSIIQIAGRVQRHRNKPIENHNIHILTQNFRALIKDKTPYSRPGYETEGNELTDKMINHGLDPENIDPVSSDKLIGTIISDSNNLITIEKNASKQYLESHYSSFLENEDIRYLGMAQTYFGFRDNDNQTNIKGYAYVADGKCFFLIMLSDGRHKTIPLDKDNKNDISLGRNVSFFGNLCMQKACASIGEDKLQSSILPVPGLKYPFSKYNEINLYRYKCDPNIDELYKVWQYSEIFGFYRKENKRRA